jgi:hypothetical protein
VRAVVDASRLAMSLDMERFILRPRFVSRLNAGIQMTWDYDSATSRSGEDMV